MKRVNTICQRCGFDWFLLKPVWGIRDVRNATVKFIEEEVGKFGNLGQARFNTMAEQLHLNLQL